MGVANERTGGSGQSWPKPAASSTLGTCSITFVGTVASSVALTVEVVREAPGYDNEPGRELPGPIAGKGAEPPAVILPKLLEHERVRVHHGVVLAVYGAHGV